MTRRTLDLPRLTWASTRSSVSSLERDDTVSTIVRALNGLMCALFLVAVVVQWNDPDPLRWVAIYGAALAACLLVAVRGYVHASLPALVGGVALVWGLVWMLAGPPADAYIHMSDAWQMKASSVEEAREASGLLIVGAWMLVLLLTQHRRAGGRQ